LRAFDAIVIDACLGSTLAVLATRSSDTLLIETQLSRTTISVIGTNFAFVVFAEFAACTVRSGQTLFASVAACIADILTRTIAVFTTSFAASLGGLITQFAKYTITIGCTARAFVLLANFAGLATCIGTAIPRDTTFVDT
jgi:hypothetical protein